MWVSGLFLENVKTTPTPCGSGLLYSFFLGGDVDLLCTRMQGLAHAPDCAPVFTLIQGKKGGTYVVPSLWGEDPQKHSQTETV